MIIINICVIDQKMSRLRILFKIDKVKAIGCWMKFHNPSRGMNLKDALPVVAVIYDVMFLA
jgi:hypothetical protein